MRDKFIWVTIIAAAILVTILVILQQEQDRGVDQRGILTSLTNNPTEANTEKGASERLTACSKWLGRAPGHLDQNQHWQLDKGTTTSSSNSGCELVSDNGLFAPFPKGSTIYLLGNSVTRDIAFHIDAMMQTGGIEDKSKVIGRDEQAAMCTKSRSAVADGEAVGFSCRLAENAVKVEFAWVTWFSNENASAFITKSDEKNAGKEEHHGNPTYLPDDICSHGPDTTAFCLRKFLEGASDQDSLYMMLGHNYPFDKAPSPTEPERQRFLDAVRASFRGSMVFSLATAVYGEFEEDPVWKRQLPEVNLSLEGTLTLTLTLTLIGGERSLDGFF